MGLQQLIYAEDIIVSQSVSYPDNDDPLELLGQIESSIYAIVYDNRGPILHTWDAESMKLKRNTAIDFLADGEILQDVIISNNNIYLFTLLESKEYFYFQSYLFDIQNDKIDTAIKIDSIPRDQFRNFKKYNIIQSKDLQYYAIMYRSVTNNEDRYNLQVYDAKATFQYKRYITTTLLHDNYSLQHIVSNQGDCLFIINENVNDDSFFKEGVAIRSHIYIINASQYLDTTYSHKAYYINQLYWQYDNNSNQLMGAGFYSNDSRRGSIGTCQIIINASTLHIAAAFYDLFPTELLNVLQARKEKLYAFHVTRIYPLLTGELLVIAEKQTREVRQAASAFNNGLGGFNDLTEMFVYGSILIYKYDINTGRSWFKILEKDQVSQNDDAYYSSFMPCNTGVDIQLFYNEIIDLRTMIKKYTLTAEGQFRNAKVCNADRENVMIVAKQGIQINNTTVLLPSVLRNELRVVKITQTN